MFKLKKGTIICKFNLISVKCKEKILIINKRTLFKLKRQNKIVNQRVKNFNKLFPK